MPRQVRIEYAGAFYHVMARGNRRGDIVFDDEDRKTFLRTLGEVCKRAGFRIHAYALMSNHYHLLLETPQANLTARSTKGSVPHNHTLISFSTRAPFPQPLTASSKTVAGPSAIPTARHIVNRPHVLSLFKNPARRARLVCLGGNPAGPASHRLPQWVSRGRPLSVAACHRCPPSLASSVLQHSRCRVGSRAAIHRG
jgi:hypothetical protein